MTVTTTAAVCSDNGSRRSLPKPVPRPTPETERFWAGTAVGELWIQRCTACTKPYFYPRDYCPRCSSDAVEWFRCSGRASLHSYVIEHRPGPGYADDVPYVVAVVELDEGPRLMTNIVGVEPDPEKLPLDLPLEVTFEARGELNIPMFAPRSE